MSTAILDISSDINKAMAHRLNADYRLPERVKNASVDALQDTAGYSSSNFADPSNGKFPCHSPEATTLHYAYFLAQQDQYPAAQRTKIASAFKQHAAFWACGDELRDLEQQHADLTKARTKQAADEEYALTFRSGHGEVQQRCYIGSVEGLKKSAEWLFAHGPDVTFDNRRLAARRIIARAEQEGVDLPHLDMLQKQAGYGCSTAEALADALRRRATIARGELKTRLYKYAEDVAHNDQLPTDIGALNKIAEQLDAIDHSNNWSGYYRSGRLQPPEGIFTLTRSKLAGMNAGLVELATGSVYSREQLAGLPAEKAVDYLGEDFVTKAAAFDGSSHLDAEMLMTELRKADQRTAAAFDRFMGKQAVAPAARVLEKRRLIPEPAEWREAANSF